MADIPSIQSLNVPEENAKSRGSQHSRVYSPSSREDRRRLQRRPQGDSLPMHSNAVERMKASARQ